MTLDERIEAGKRELRRLLTEYGVIFKDGRRFDQLSQAYSRAFAPELFTSPPTMLLMPMEWPGEAEASMYWRTWRDAHLNREGK